MQAASALFSIAALFLGSMAFGGVARAAPAPSLLPLPASMTVRSGAFAPPPIIGVSVPVGDAAARLDAQWLATEAARIGKLKVRIGGARAAVTFARAPASAALGEEGYTLDIDAKGLHIAAATDAGLFHGAATALQLLTPGPASARPVPLPYLHIADTPRFPWRGLMLDSARHLQSVALIEALLDQMARYKLNTFHWHLTDDQGWRLEIRKYPRLTAVGGWRVEAGVPHRLDIDRTTGRPRRYGGFYTQAEVRAVVAYAAARGITVVPEIEMPGHASAAIFAYPELGLKPVDPATLGDWGVFPNLYAPNARTEAFLEAVLTEVMDLFPGRYIHVGGDEAVKDYWKTSPVVQAQIRQLGLKDEDELQGWFINRIGRFLAAHGRKLIGWDEILQGGLPEDAAVMSWHGISGGIQAAKLGHDAVLTPGMPFYFDNRLSPANDEPPGRGLVIALSDVYAYDPLPPSIDAAVAGHILGIQANVWTEHIRLQDRVEHMAFPRAAALAEIGWSPQAARSWPDFLSRLRPAMRRDEAMGLRPAESALSPRATAISNPQTRDNHQLMLCSTGGALNLEAPGPVASEHRPTYLADFTNPCWQWKDADMTGVARIAIAAGRLPFNFLGVDDDKIPLRRQTTAEGELIVHADGCDGPVIATVPMPWVGADPQARVSGRIDPLSGRHDLCFLFTRATLDPWWALGSVELKP